jgi:FixJ family two-component response regulator
VKPKVEPLSPAVISIVDDDESLRAAMSSLVRSLGHEARVFDSAESFLASPRLDDTSCLIVDVQMPGMSGLDLQAELRTRRVRFPIIFITAFPEDRIRRHAEVAGAVGFLSKPVDGHTIVERLNAAISESD